MSLNPALSIVLSTRNHREFLPGCLQGILGQTWGNFEFLIVDDGSTDDSWACLQDWAQQDRRIRISRRERALGVIDSYNHLFRQAKGNYLWSVATDDHCINQYFLQEGFEMLKRYPQAAGFYAAMNIVKIPGEFFEKRWTAGNRNRYLSPEKIMQLFWKDEGYPCGPCLVLQKTWYEKFHGWYPDLGPQCDLFLNLVAGASSGLAYLAKPSVVHRMWPTGQSYLSRQTIEDLVSNVARMECRARKTLPAFLHREAEWTRWRVGFLQRATNSKHALKKIFPTDLKNKLIFSKLRAWMKIVKNAEFLYQKAFRMENASRESNRGLSLNPAIQVSRQLRQNLIFRQSLHIFIRLIISFRFFYQGFLERK